jgi:hypothetical protein
MFIFVFYTSCEVKRGLSFSYLIYRTKELKAGNQSEIYDYITNPAYEYGLLYLRYRAVLSLMSLHEVLFNFVLGIYKRTVIYVL